MAKSPGTPGDKGSNQAGQDNNPKSPSGDQAAELSRGPAGTQMGKDKDGPSVELPEGSTADTRREAVQHFGEGTRVGPAKPPARQATHATGPEEGEDEDRPKAWSQDQPEGKPGTRAEFPGQKPMTVKEMMEADKELSDACTAKFSKAIEEIAGGIKKLADAGMGGEAAGHIVFNCWRMCNESANKPMNTRRGY